MDADSDGLSDANERFHYKSDPTVWDSDGDGVGDGVEAVDGTSPINPNDPPNANGVVSYNGTQTGAVRILAVTVSNAWTSAWSDTLDEPGIYRIAALPASNYWLKAFRDLDGDGELGEIEARGEYPVNPAEIGQQVTGLDIVLTDPDSDGDGLSDYEEIYALGTNPNNPADGAAMLQAARSQIITHWRMVFGTALVFTNASGSQADLNDLRNAMQALSGEFHELEGD